MSADGNAFSPAAVAAMPTVPPAAALPLAESQAQLFQRGLAELRARCGLVWTDHNAHDPGITLLEALAWALADLGTRAALPLEDLLASQAADGLPGAGGEAFLTARQLLPGRAVTLLDLRKRLIDLPGVQNAWLLPSALSYWFDPVAQKLHLANPGTPGAAEVPVQGVYDVRVEALEGLAPEARDAMLASVDAALHAHRGLAQDFTAPQLVKEESFVVCAELELAPEADVAEVWAAAVHAVQRHLSPRVRRYTLDEMRARGLAPDAIFEGPRLEHGFVDAAELAATDLRTSLRLSDVIHVLMQLPAVRAVRRIHLNAGTEAEGSGLAAAGTPQWVIPVRPRRQAVLAVDASRLVFFKHGMPVTATKAARAAALARRLDAERAAEAALRCDDLPVPPGRRLDVAAQRPVQLDLPALYGTGEQGFPAGADAADRARVLQLKGYLHLFEQLLADDAAQLTHLGALFSINPFQQRSAFSQAVTGAPWTELVHAPVSDAALAAQLDGGDDAARLLHLQRRNALLDHLLARLGESFAEYAALNATLFPTDALGVQSAVLADKAAFLGEAALLSADRGGGHDRLGSAASLWNSAANLSGLERRIGRLLGLDNLARRPLSRVATDVYAEVDATPGDEPRFRVRHRDTGKILLSSDGRYATRALAQTALRAVLSRAQDESAYQRRQARDGRHHFNVLDEHGAVIARRVEYFATAEARDAAIEALVAYLREWYSEEGFYLIENLLLRPADPGAGAAPAFFTVCADEDCADCAGRDPYSHRLHFVLPAWAGRFADPHFRDHAERVIREETPAHLLPKICWLGRDEMQAVERAWQAWLLLPAGADAPQRNKRLATLVAALEAGKNVYPPALLHACEGEQEKFILGRSALGSARGRG